MTGEYYKKAYDETFEKCPRWKQCAIVEDIKNKKNSGILSDFIQTVISLAEYRFDSEVSLIKNESDTKKITSKSKKPKKSKKTTLK